MSVKCWWEIWNFERGQLKQNRLLNKWTSVIFSKYYKVIDIDWAEMGKVYQASSPLSTYPLLCLATLTVTATNKEESNKENNKAKDSKSRIIHQNNNNNNNNNVTTRTKGSNFYKLAVNTKINLRYKYRFCMWMLNRTKKLSFLSILLYYLSNKLVKC